MVFSKLLVSVEGTNLSSRFIPNEITVSDIKTIGLRHYFFNAPKGSRLSPEERTTEWYTRVHLNGRGMRDYQIPALDFERAQEIVTSLKGHKIYVVGNVTKAYLSTILPLEDIVDVQEKCNLKYPTTLHATGCGENHAHYRNCSKSKLIFAKNFMKANTALWE